jgi:ParB-like chromosome segregation protein Spo0J
MRTINNLNITALKIHPRNQEFFDDIDGEEYEQFKRSIQEEGIITPLLVAPDMVLVSGHQRYKAAKELGINLIPVIIDENIISEEEKLKKLLAANFGRMKNNPVKQRKVAVQYIELCGLKKGRPNKIVDNRLFSMDEIAKQLGTSETTLKELLLIERKLTPEIKELLDEGIITKTSASKIWVKLSEKEQLELLEELGKDKITEMTQQQLKKYIEENNEKIKQAEELQNKYKDIDVDKLVIDKEDALKKEEEANKKIKALEKENNNLKEQEPQIIEVEIEKEVIPDDVKKELEENRKKLAELQPIKVRYENEELENGSLYLGFKSSIERFLESNAELVYSEIPNNLKDKMHKQAIILKKWLNDFEINIFKEENLNEG